MTHPPYLLINYHFEIHGRPTQGINDSKSNQATGQPHRAEHIVLLLCDLAIMVLEHWRRYNQDDLEKISGGVSANREALSSSRSHFLSLPGELRIDIYELILGVSTSQRLEVSINTDQYASSDTGRLVFQCSKQPDYRLDLAVFRVNKQIYRESLPILYKNCIFYPLADAPLLAVFFGPMSDFARSNILRLHLKPRPHKAVRLVGPRATLSEVMRGPSWSPACEKISVLFPDLEELLIHLHPIYGYGLGDGDQLDWIIRPLSRLQGIQKVLASVGNGSDDAKTPEMNRNWNNLVKKADSDAKEYMASRTRIMENKKGWPSPYWITKRRFLSP